MQIASQELMFVRLGVCQIDAVVHRSGCQQSTACSRVPRALSKTPRDIGSRIPTCPSRVDPDESPIITYVRAVQVATPAPPPRAGFRPSTNWPLTQTAVTGVRYFDWRVLLQQ